MDWSAGLPLYVRDEAPLSSTLMASFGDTVARLAPLKETLASEAVTADKSARLAPDSSRSMVPA